MTVRQPANAMPPRRLSSWGGALIHAMNVTPATAQPVTGLLIEDASAA